MPITLVTYNAHDTKQVPFFSHIFSKIQKHAKGPTIFAGDSNKVLIPQLDKSSSIKATKTTDSNSSSNKLTHLFSQYSLLNAWRELHRIKKIYIF